MRMPHADLLLPERVSLPFDLLLVLHWAESLHKCTGVHAAVLCAAGEVEIAEWEKHGEDFGDTWGSLVASLDPGRDVLLFPSSDAVLAQEMDWAVDSALRGIGNGVAAERGRKRLIVLEASWSHAKTMYTFIARYRSMNGLPPLRCVALTDIVGKYWRFHEEGNSAVSTIEAIAHTAEAAGATEETLHSLTVLFRLQRHRVLISIAVADGERPASRGGDTQDGSEFGCAAGLQKKKPRAVTVSGSPGLGDWSLVPGYSTEDGGCST